MSVKYIITEKGNPGNPREPKKFYAATKADGEITMRQLSREVSAHFSFLTPKQAAQVLEITTHILSRHLSEGKIARLGEFGSFRVSVSSRGAETSAEFTPAHIHTSKIVFHPGAILKEMTATLEFEEYKS